MIAFPLWFHLGAHVGIRLLNYLPFLLGIGSGVDFGGLYRHVAKEIANVYFK